MGRATPTPRRVCGWPGWGTASPGTRWYRGGRRCGAGLGWLACLSLRRVKGTAQAMTSNEGDTTELALWTVTPGEAAVLVQAFQEADLMAMHLRAALLGSGLGPDVVSVAGTVTDSGRPVVRVDLSTVGAARLVASLDASGHPPPRRRDGPAAGPDGRSRAA